MDATVENRGGCWCIGNGQLHDAMTPSYETSKTLNCMDDPMKILIVEEEDDLPESNRLADGSRSK